MVVVTLERTATCILESESRKHPLLNGNTLNCTEQSVVSQRMLLNHRRTLSPDKLLFLKVPEHVAPASEPPVTETFHLKRSVTPEGRLDEAERAYEAAAPPRKKARLVLLSSLPPPAPVRRVVRFACSSQKDGTTAVKTQVRLFDRVEPQDIASIWYSGEEMLEIMSREKSAISVMSYCCEHYTTQVLCLMKMARDKSSVPGMATTESSAPLWVANSLARGLEKDIVRGFKQRKRHVIRKVLESQRVLKMGRHEVTGESASPELQSRLLSAQYEKWSHPMVRFAQVLAEGDAQVVVDNAAAAARAPCVIDLYD